MTTVNTHKPFVTNELVKFKLIQCPECGHSLCWLNPRLPNCCPECGNHILGKLRTERSTYIVMEANAWLRLEEESNLPWGVRVP